MSDQAPIWVAAFLIGYWIGGFLQHKVQWFTNFLKIFKGDDQ